MIGCTIPPIFGFTGMAESIAVARDGEEVVTVKVGLANSSLEKRGETLLPGNREFVD